jgi:polyisoprenoid-binding protein YceI
VKVNLADGSLQAEASPFKINRTDFGIKYGSSLMDEVKDRVIADDVELSFTLAASK